MNRRRLTHSASALFPSPCTQGEGKGGGFLAQSAFGPHPSPPPEYKGRGEYFDRRRGVIFVTALGIIVVLTGLALVFAQAMRTEALASANRRSQAQADAMELGAEQWVLAQIDEYRTDAYTLTALVPTDTLSVGSTETTGYFWILPADISTFRVARSAALRMNRRS